jgi:hypothetical protein
MLSALYTSRCIITKQTSAKDTVGRVTYTSVNHKEDVRCRLDSLRFRSQEVSEPGTVQSILRAMIYTEPIPGITPDMQIVLNGNTYNIISINSMDGLVVDSHLEIEVNLITNG